MRSFLLKELKLLGGATVVAAALAACGTVFVKGEPEAGKLPVTPVTYALDKALPAACVEQRLARMDLLIDWLGTRTDTLEETRAVTQTSRDLVKGLYAQNAHPALLTGAALGVLASAYEPLLLVVQEYEDDAASLSELELGMAFVGNLTAAGVDTLAMSAQIAAVPCT